jgi:hypothetical protein
LSSDPPRLASARLASPRLASPRLASPRLTSPRLDSTRFGGRRLSVVDRRSSVVDRRSVGRHTGNQPGVPRPKVSLGVCELKSRWYEGTRLTQPIDSTSSRAQRPHDVL